MAQRLLEFLEAPTGLPAALGDGDPDGQQMDTSHAPVEVVRARALLALGAVEDVVGALSVLGRDPVDVAGEAHDLAAALLEEVQRPLLSGGGFVCAIR